MNTLPMRRYGRNPNHLACIHEGRTLRAHLCPRYGIWLSKVSGYVIGVHSNRVGAVAHLEREVSRATIQLPRAA